MVTQAVIFDKDIWDTSRAKRWLNKNKLYPIKRVHETMHFYRYRIREPDYDHLEYKTTNLGYGIKVIVGYPYSEFYH